ncbi:hypothetical protein [Actinobacillus porcinus]|uniref:hypothetical protein n=1 Tax=Actinobacillus porcinus TaxID=51048 RepID=UPI00235564E0|nr:hypothetical protein [Actinobacillus porcinus]
MILKNKNLLKILGVSFIVGLSACSSPPPTPVEKPKINWTMQPIEDAIHLRAGMSEIAASEILGRPIVREFEGRGSALQWCKTGLGGTSFPYDRYLIGFFYDEKLVGTRNYTTKDSQQFGDCATLYREIEWTPSDTIIEYRFRN